MSALEYPYLIFLHIFVTHLNLCLSSCNSLGLFIKLGALKRGTHIMFELYNWEWTDTVVVIIISDQFFIV